MVKQSLIITGALLCFIGMMVVPVAAFTPAAQMTTWGNSPIDPGLEDELWAIHVEHRLDRYDGNVQTAYKVITALDSHGYDTTNLSVTLTKISGQRDALSNALNNQDRAALKDINRELLSLRKDFRQEFRHLLKGT
jgi:hypothetical protein